MPNPDAFDDNPFAASQSTDDEVDASAEQEDLAEDCPLDALVVREQLSATRGWALMLVMMASLLVAFFAFSIIRVFDVVGLDEPTWLALPGFALVWHIVLAIASLRLILRVKTFEREANDETLRIALAAQTALWATIAILTLMLLLAMCGGFAWSLMRVASQTA